MLTLSSTSSALSPNIPARSPIRSCLLTFMVFVRFERAEAGGSKVPGAKLRFSCRGVSGSGGSDDRAELGGRPKDENGSKVGRGLGKRQVNNGVVADL
jgi:hypothetical protein